ncbi:MAG: DUF6503 family protein [Ekhidna sp.]
MKKLFLLFCLCPMFSFSQMTAEMVLAKANEYHDSNKEWASLIVTFLFTETRPDGSESSSTFELNNATGFAKISRGDDKVYEVSGEEAKVLKGDDGKERALMMRNYYLYLWGLPMKLYDEGTPMDGEVGEEIVNEIECYVLRVPYEKDVWYFSIDKQTGRMVQYKFYKDEDAGKGELITLEGEMSIGDMKIPKNRSWYTLPEMKYLGTDILSGVE